MGVFICSGFYWKEVFVIVKAALNNLKGFFPLLKFYS